MNALPLRRVSWHKAVAGNTGDAPSRSSRGWKPISRLGRERLETPTPTWGTFGRFGLFKSKRARLITAGAVVASMSFGGYAVAQSGGGVPANKVTAAASKRVVFGPGTNQTLMTATFKTSKRSEEHT